MGVIFPKELAGLLERSAEAWQQTAVVAARILAKQLSAGAMDRLSTTIHQYTPPVPVP